jgi:hypothetical protein
MFTHPIPCILYSTISGAGMLFYLFSLHSMMNSFDIMMDSHVDKLVLRLSLNHTGSLTSDHLNCSLNVNFTLKSVTFDLINNHVNDDKSTGTTNTGRTMDNDWSRTRFKTVLL